MLDYLRTLPVYSLSSAITHYNVLRGFRKPVKFKMRFFCDNKSYSDICYIPSGNLVQQLKKRIESMSFSDGSLVKPDNPLWYAKLCYAFKCHLDNVDRSSLHTDSYHPDTKEEFSFDLNLTYRTSHRYKKRNIARGYKLIEQLNVNPSDVKREIKYNERKLSFQQSLLESASKSSSVATASYVKSIEDTINGLYKELDRLNNQLGLLYADGVTLVTFTASQRGADYIQYTQDIQVAKSKLHDNIRKNHPKVPYVVSVEAHKTGYIHFHVVYGCNIPEDERHRLKLLWSESYGMGSYDNGLQFSFFDGAKTSNKGGQREYKNDIDGAVRYLIKYIAKSMSGGLDQLEQRKDSLKLEFYKADKGKNASLPKEEIQKRKEEISKELTAVRDEIEDKRFGGDGLYPFHQLLADAYIWYVSKTSNKEYGGVRTFYINPVWNSLIRDFFSHDSVLICTDVVLTYGNKEKVIMSGGVSAKDVPTGVG